MDVKNVIFPSFSITETKSYLTITLISCRFVRGLLLLLIFFNFELVAMITTKRAEDSNIKIRVSLKTLTASKFAKLKNAISCDVNALRKSFNI